MADEIFIDEVEELTVFGNECRDIREHLRVVKDCYAADTVELGGAWQDEHYKTLCAKVSPIISECQNAIDIITNSLLPFIEKKSQAAAERPEM